MAWDVAKSLDVLLGQINALAPGRSRASDGSIGDQAHQAQGSASEHNPEDKLHPEPDEVDARDFTHDPAHGADMDVISEQLRLSRDRRIKYVIWRQRIFSSYPSGGIPAWTWRPYSGQYHSHLHVSVNDVADDDTTPWAIGPSKGGIMPALSDDDQRALIWRVEALTGGRHTVGGGPTAGEPVRLTKRLDDVAARLAALESRPAGTVALTAEDRAALVAGLAEALGPVALEAAAEAVRQVLGGLDGAVPPGQAQ